MHITRLAMLSALTGLAAMAPSALASPPQTVTSDPAGLKADWTGPTATGLNTSYFLGGTGPIPDGSCANAEPQTACDATLVHLTGTAGEGSTLTFRIDGFLPISDFDLRVSTANPDGSADTYLGSPTSSDVSESSPLGSDDPRYTFAGDYENKVVNVADYADPDTGAVDQYFLVEVPYFVVTSDAYTGHATLDAKPFVPPVSE